MIWMGVEELVCIASMSVILTLHVLRLGLPSVQDNTARSRTRWGQGVPQNRRTFGVIHCQQGMERMFGSFRIT
ncbi:hypothetical protein OE88DRAFT_1660000 [Heliocybe sulcata]|uniref:Uncharacterized protein n=1 Tax=Heliocybe sulcata TaxID=5364 RepID=A0A5C3MZV5_9AGAM|nr:hypothetical protein OE88DRAFT_1660000 [Heliocybe sulcata]